MEQDKKLKELYEALDADNLTDAQMQEVKNWTEEQVVAYFRQKHNFITLEEFKRRLDEITEKNFGKG